MSFLRGPLLDYVILCEQIWGKRGTESKVKKVNPIGMILATKIKKEFAAL